MVQSKCELSMTEIHERSSTVSLAISLKTCFISLPSGLMFLN